MAPAPSPLDPTALARAGDSLQRAGQALVAGDLDAMLPHLETALRALCELTRGGQVITRASPPAAYWDGEAAAGLLWQLLARLKGAGCSAFPYAGTLLGLERDGRLLPHDKDADIAVWLEDFSLCCNFMQQLGFQRAGNQPPFGNMASLVEARSGLTVDVFGIRRDPARQVLEGGVWLYGKPASHQRVIHLEWFTLAARESPAGEVWWPDPPSALLSGLYGDWRTPRPEWDSLVSCLALKETNLHWRCTALKNLSDRWLQGDAARTRRLVDQIVARAGGDALLQECATALDTAIARQTGTAA